MGHPIHQSSVWADQTRWERSQYCGTFHIWSLHCSSSNVESSDNVILTVIPQLHLWYNSKQSNHDYWGQYTRTEHVSHLDSWHEKACLILCTCWKDNRVTEAIKEMFCFIQKHFRLSQKKLYPTNNNFSGFNLNNCCSLNKQRKGTD